MSWIKSITGKIPAGVWYSLLGILVVMSYLPARKYMIVQTAWVWVVKSNVSVNLILFLFMWGVVCDKVIARKMPRIKSWIIWGIGLAIIIMVVKYVIGVETR